MPLVLKIELIRLRSSILPEPEQPSAQLSKLIRLTACKKAMHATSRWYRTVYIPWLVASYDTHMGKRWLNSNPPNHGGYPYNSRLYSFPFFFLFKGWYCGAWVHIIVYICWYCGADRVHITVYIGWYCGASMVHITVSQHCTADLL